ncbi:uncharacterized protein LOC143177918 [Calliopsis andreniformis]|uniref:uncharacterized protein LOC143177918 n=1 Tax=Calliopsis andreniformis TaxID=337506 RepID=UPI003FCDAB93
MRAYRVCARCSYGSTNCTLSVVPREYSGSSLGLLEDNDGTLSLVSRRLVIFSTSTVLLLPSGIGIVIPTRVFRCAFNRHRNCPEKPNPSVLESTWTVCLSTFKMGVLQEINTLAHGLRVPTLSAVCTCT